MRSRFPLKQSVLHERYSGTGLDELNNEIKKFDPPVREPVFGWEPWTSTEEVIEGHVRVVTKTKVYAPQAMGAMPKDRLSLAGKVFDVQGDPEDPNYNSFWQPGLVTVNVRRVEG